MSEVKQELEIISQRQTIQNITILNTSKSFVALPTYPRLSDKNQDEISSNLLGKQESIFSQEFIKPIEILKQPAREEPKRRIPLFQSKPKQVVNITIEDETDEAGNESRLLTKQSLIPSQYDPVLIFNQSYLQNPTKQTPCHVKNNKSTAKPIKLKTLVCLSPSSSSFVKLRDCSPA